MQFARSNTSHVWCIGRHRTSKVCQQNIARPNISSGNNQNYPSKTNTFQIQLAIIIIIKSILLHLISLVQISKDAWHMWPLLAEMILRDVLLGYLINGVMQLETSIDKDTKFPKMHSSSLRNKNLITWCVENMLHSVYTSKITQHCFHTILKLF